MNAPAGLPRLRILTALIAVFVLVSIVPLVLSHVRLVAINREALETAEKQYLARSAVNLADGIGTYVRSMQVQVRKIAEGLQLAAALSPEKDPFGFVGRSALIGEYRQAEPNFLVLRALDRDQVGGAAQPVKIDPPLEAELGRAFAAAVRGTDYTGEPFRFPTEPFQDGGIVVAVPVLSPSREPIGVVESFVSLAPVKEMLAQERKRDLVAYVVDRRGTLILESERDAAPAGEALLREGLVPEFMAHPVRLTRSYERGAGPLARRVLGTVAPVGDSLAGPDWGVIVEKDEAKAFAAVAQMTEVSTYVGGFALLFAVLVAIPAARVLSRPVRDLATKVQQVAEGNYSQKVAVRGTRELAELSETFNFMSEELEKSVEKLKLAARENQELFFSSIRALAAAIDAKDPYTRGHSERVARYSVTVARHMGLPSDEIRKVRIAALLHDVGKIGIDDRILRKPTALTDEEFEIMKSHPVKGALIMGQIPQLKSIIPGMRFHHEKWDGGGYPDGLRREEIPLYARVISIADTFDAMTTTRPYQKAMALSYVVSRIKSFSGSRFDPAVVDALDKAVSGHELEVVGEAARLAAVSA